MPLLTHPIKHLKQKNIPDMPPTFEVCDACVIVRAGNVFLPNAEDQAG
jgi:hypothetical protein